MQPTPTTVSVPIRLGRTKTQLRASTTIKIHSGATEGSGLSNANPLRVCGVCHENESKYTCPRCNAAYCGVPCFKAHGTTCTEEFYKGHVESEMRLNKSSDTVRDVQQMLQRVHDDFPETSPIDERIDTLVELMESNALTLDALTDEERANFLREVADGRLGKFVALWEPWWTSPLVAYEARTHATRHQLIVDLDSSLDEGDDDDDDLTHPIGLFTASIDAAVPPILSLHPSPNHDILQCNVIEVLFAYAYMMRVYNGDWRVDVLEAGALCVASSTVLHGPGHFDAISQVVHACRVSNAMAEGNDATKHAALVDAATIAGQRLFVLDSLCDLHQLLHTMQAASTKASRKSLARVVKKVEFYLAWARDPTSAERFPVLQQQLMEQLP
ncbi:Aste57867_23978 [Aphanomyces stellatus]|uniref:Aste57867_23978 protein n=1 Tax=Aphanomyces stellatus TaxID=120398 RepID=A0A485LP80_9STRA|nr:hypothetical protein As57867_023905 [Aphanomyces stellatus]VFU00621.1 Aste57867_23978 [Aphanomyces stellatus]